MLEKTMKQVLLKKIKQWTDSIEDVNVKEFIKKNIIVTGGCFTSFIQNEEPKDFDIYFRNKETVLAVAQYYAKVWNDTHKNQENKAGYRCNLLVLDCDYPSNEVLNYYRCSNRDELLSNGAIMVSNLEKGRIKMIFPSDGIVEDPENVRASEELGVQPEEIITELDEKDAEEKIKKEKRPFHPVFVSSNAITLSEGIQIIVRFYGEPSEIHDTFDFVHTKAYFDINDEIIQIPKEVYEAVVNKTLRYTGSKYPVCSLFRLRKFIERGWKINAGQILKIAMQVSDLNLKDINVLEDQLVGVDSLYFMSLINKFREQEKNKDFTLTTDYITSIIDKIF